MSALKPHTYEQKIDLAGGIHICLCKHLHSSVSVCATLIFKDKEAIGLREGSEGGFLGRAGGWNRRRESDIILFQLKAFKFLKIVFKTELNEKQSRGPFSFAYLPCSSQLLT